MSAMPTSCLLLPQTETPPERDEPQDLQEPSESVAPVETDAEADASPRVETEIPAQAMLLMPLAIRVPHQPSRIVSTAEEIPVDEVAVDDVTTDDTTTDGTLHEESDIAHLVAREDKSEPESPATDTTVAARSTGAELVTAPRYRLAELKRERRRVADMQEVLQSLLTFLTQEAARNRARQRRQRIASAGAGLLGLLLLVGVWTVARHTQERPMLPTQAGTSVASGEATCLGASCGTLDISMFRTAAATGPAKSAIAPASPPVLPLMDAENGTGDRTASDTTATDALPPSRPPRPARIAIIETLSPSADGTALATRATADILLSVDRVEPIDPSPASTPAAARVDNVEVAAIEAVDIGATSAADVCSDATCPHISEAPLGTVMLPSHGAAALTAARQPAFVLVEEDAPDTDADFADVSVTNVVSVANLAVRGLVSGVTPDQAPLAIALAPSSVSTEGAPTEADLADVDLADVESVRSLAVRGRVAHAEPDPALTAKPTRPDTEAADLVAADLVLSSETALVLPRALDADPLTTAGRALPPRATAPRRRPPSLLQPAVRHSVAKATRAKGLPARARSAQKQAAPAAVIQPRGLFQFEPPKTAPAAAAARTTPTSKPLRKGAKAPDSKS